MIDGDDANTTKFHASELLGLICGLLTMAKEACTSACVAGLLDRTAHIMMLWRARREILCNLANLHRLTRPTVKACLSAPIG